MKIFVINGSGGSGKDTFVNLVYAIIKEVYPNQMVDATSTIDPIKDIAKRMGWNGEKTPEARKFLSDLKDLSTEFNGGPFVYVKSFIQGSRASVIFIHCREPKEIQKIVDYFDAKTILINADKRVPVIESNHADANTKDYNYDYIINNNGTMIDLTIEAAKFVKDIMEEWK